MEFLIIFESIFKKNHLDNINYKMPLKFINFKKIILHTMKIKIMKFLKKNIDNILSEKYLSLRYFYNCF